MHHTFIKFLFIIETSGRGLIKIFQTKRLNRSQKISNKPSVNINITKFTFFSGADYVR